MFNREQFMMTGVVFLFLYGTFLFLSGMTVLRHKQLYGHQMSNLLNIESEASALTAILLNAPESSNSNEMHLRARSRNRPHSAVVNSTATTSDEIESHITYSADFNNLVDIRSKSYSAHNVDKTTLESTSDSPCVGVWNKLGHDSLSHSVCIELYRDNGDNQPNSQKDTLVGFTLVTDHLSALGDYQFNNLLSGNYFAKFYNLGHDALASLAMQTSVSDVEKDYNSWETALIEAEAVETGYSIKFEHEEALKKNR